VEIHKKIIERVTITGKMEDEVDKAFDYCYSNQYRVISQGPRMISELRCNVNEFIVVAEREKEVK